MAHRVLYDGVCGLCDRMNRFILAHDAREQFHFASLQSAIAGERLSRFGIKADELSTVYVLPDYERSESRPLGRAAAALFVASALGWPWKIAAVLRVVPMAWLDRAYEAVARRHAQAVEVLRGDEIGAGAIRLGEAEVEARLGHGRAPAGMANERNES